MKELTTAEEEVMNVIWKLERCTVRDIIDDMNTEPRPPHSTISSVVRILEKKGFLDHKAYGRTYEYFPKVTKEEYSKKTINSVVSKYFGGSVKKLVSFLVKKEDLSAQDLSEMIDRLDKSEREEEDKGE